MNKLLCAFGLSAILSAFLMLPAAAQQFDIPNVAPPEQFVSAAAGAPLDNNQFMSGGQGEMGYTTQTTGTQGVPYKTTLLTGKQNKANDPTTTTQLGGIFGPAGRNGLPQTSLDSFVHQAAGDAELIYGDEGIDGPPPYMEFDKTHRIERGITGVRYQGLATGHSSYLPDAWGGDEWTGNEWDQSGNGSDAIPRYGGGLGNWAANTAGAGF